MLGNRFAGLVRLRLKTGEVVLQFNPTSESNIQPKICVKMCVCTKKKKH